MHFPNSARVCAIGPSGDLRYCAHQMMAALYADWAKPGDTCPGRLCFDTNPLDAYDGYRNGCPVDGGPSNHFGTDGAMETLWIRGEGTVFHLVPVDASMRSMFITWALTGEESGILVSDIPVGVPRAALSNTDCPFEPIDIAMSDRHRCEWALWYSRDASPGAVDVLADVPCDLGQLLAGRATPCIDAFAGRLDELHRPDDSPKDRLRRAKTVVTRADTIIRAMLRLARCPGQKYAGPPVGPNDIVPAVLSTAVKSVVVKDTLHPYESLANLFESRDRVPLGPPPDGYAANTTVPVVQWCKDTALAYAARLLELQDAYGDSDVDHLLTQ